MKRFSGLVIFILALLLFGTRGTAAADFAYNLTVPNANLPSLQSLGIPYYGTVKVNRVNDHDYRISVRLEDDLSSKLNGNGKHFGLDQFYFNTDINASDLILSNFDPERWNASKNRNADGFGKFDIRLVDPTIWVRETFLQFDILYDGILTDADFDQLSNGRARNGEGHFAAHIAGFDYHYGPCKDICSTFVRDDLKRVPEPGTLMLLSSGLVGIAFFRRRRME